MTKEEDAAYDRRLAEIAAAAARERAAAEAARQRDEANKKGK